MSAHAMVQEYLNLQEQLYGLVKLSYLEFDLDRIVTDGLFTDDYQLNLFPPIILTAKKENP